MYIYIYICIYVYIYIYIYIYIGIHTHRNAWPEQATVPFLAGAVSVSWEPPKLSPRTESYYYYYYY